MDNTLVSSASKFYQAATSKRAPIIYGKLRNWLLDEEIYTSTDVDRCGCSTILKKVGKLMSDIGTDVQQDLANLAQYRALPDGIDVGAYVEHKRKKPKNF